MDSSYSIVEYFGSSEGSNCGYCKGNQEGSRATFGMWAHMMDVKTYQQLLDRGWRRSGKYCYKPQMSVSCCPQYTIKCNVGENILTKSQRKCLKNFHNFVENGHIPKETAPSTNKPRQVKPKVRDSKPPTKTSCDESQKDDVKENTCNDKDRSNKKKYKRYLRKVEKLRNRMMSEEQISEHFKKKKEAKLEKQKPKEIDFYFKFSDNSKHKFRVELVQSAEPAQFKTHAKSEFNLYQAYQTSIHKDDKKDITNKQFSRFLVDSPLNYRSLRRDSPYKAGSFHQLYWLDDKLIAVGVIDILETCLSGVYFFYDPSYNFLSLGKVSALYEISFTKKIGKVHCDFIYYYMGFYIHSCPKMKYKGEYRGSYLLCPETYSWYPVEKVQPLLDQTKYCRFADAKTPVPVAPNLNQLSVLYRNSAMDYQTYKMFNPEENDTEELLEMCKIFGKDAIKDLFVVRK